ncbi:SCO2521 family protein [Catellatospora bangladeshensis]|uniref:SCO2521 family protein n=1 Tax=Catellatospora bangladeshensis TaxID=310355 RepID=UPI003607CFBE
MNAAHAGVRGGRTSGDGGRGAHRTAAHLHRAGRHRHRGTARPGAGSAGAPLGAADRPRPVTRPPYRRRLPLANSGARVRGVGTVCTRATITGGHVAQASAYARVVRGTAGRRLPWSHYLATPGTIETIGKVDAGRITDAVLTGEPGDALNLDAIGNRTLDQVQHDHRLDHRPAFRTARTRLRWAAGPAGTPVAVSLRVDDPTTRTLRLRHRRRRPRRRRVLRGPRAARLAAHHPARDGGEPSGRVRARGTVARVRPAIDFLLHLWMPAARTDPAFEELWRDLEHRPGFSRQWRVNVDRIRDQLALDTIERLGR